MFNIALFIINIILSSVSLVLIYISSTLYYEIQDLKLYNEILLNKIEILEENQSQSGLNKKVILAIISVSTILAWVYLGGGPGDISSISDLLLASSDRLAEHVNEHSATVHEHLGRMNNRSTENSSNILRNIQEVLRVVSRLDVLLRFGHLSKKPVSSNFEKKSDVSVSEEQILTTTNSKNIFDLTEDSFDFV